MGTKLSRIYNVEFYKYGDIVRGNELKRIVYIMNKEKGEIYYQYRKLKNGWVIYGSNNYKEISYGIQNNVPIRLEMVDIKKIIGIEVI